MLAPVWEGEEGADAWAAGEGRAGRRAGRRDGGEAGRARGAGASYEDGKAAPGADMVSSDEDQRGDASSDVGRVGRT